MAEKRTQVAIVTGGSRGIGRGIAEALLGEGWPAFPIRAAGRTRAGG